MTPVGEVDRLADAMVADWHAGRRHPAEHYLRQVPALDTNGALELIAEEIALRSDDPAAVPPSFEELRLRFPQWAEPLRKLCRFHAVLGTSSTFEVGPPSVGEQLGEFTLESVLGRGAHSTVFKARQASLAGREVVLKISPDTGEEHISLARLQHTHIVPLHSVHEFPERGLRALCMPYFGGETLASLMANPHWRPDDRSIATLGVSLAEALAYAHERGLLHLDVKPANVLIAADGTPMLLDFHLARAPMQAGTAAPTWMGGTSGYMPPEQEAALKSVQKKTPIAQSVDIRADLFALGRLLESSAGSARLSAGLHSILSRCTQMNPAERYESAAALADDFRRHLADQPLRGVPNRSLRERWVKWRRRRPLALPFLLALLACLTVLAGVFGSLRNRAVDARLARQSGDAHLAAKQFTAAGEAYRRGEELLSGNVFERTLREELRNGIRRADQGGILAKLHDIIEQLRPVYATQIPPALNLKLSETCRKLWDRRAEFAKIDLPECREDLLELGILYATLTEPHTAITILNEAETLLGASPLIHIERARHAATAGMTEMAAAERTRTDGVPATTSFQYVCRGRALLASGNAAAAAALLDRALELEVASLWANYYRGEAAMKMKDAPRALAAFSVCVALAPQSGWCWRNRGLAYANCGDTARAQADYAVARQLEPDLPLP